MKNFVFLFCLLSFICCGASDKFMIISVPKSGTHLISKLMQKMTNKGHGFAGHHTNQMPLIEKLESFNTKNSFCHVHLMYSRKDLECLLSHGYKILFIYRDPRDQVVSFAFYIPKIPGVWRNAANFSFSGIVDELILNNTFYKQLWPRISGVNQFYQGFLPWIDADNVLPIRFEDLIGLQGGGSQEAQHTVITKIAQFLGIEIDEQITKSIFKHLNECVNKKSVRASKLSIQQMENNLFGGSSTFRKGQIGAWKTHFNEGHKKLFKEIAGQLLIDLGYEDGLDW